MELPLRGVVKVTGQGVIQPTGVALRIWTVHSLSTTTSITIYDAGSFYSTTGTTLYLSQPVLAGVNQTLDLHSGVRFPYGAVLYTDTNFTGATIICSTEF
jgi:hypothetical protein